jgi:hypothetical protein
MLLTLVIENVINLQKVYPRVDHKTTIEHAGFFTEKQADQLAELGCLGQSLVLFFSSQNVSLMYDLMAFFESNKFFLNSCFFLIGNVISKQNKIKNKILKAKKLMVILFH